MFRFFGAGKENNDDNEEKAKKLTSKVNKMREDLAKEVIDDETLEGFIELLNRDFSREGIEVNKNTVTAFRTGFELIVGNRLDEDHFEHMIVTCDRYLAEERDKEDLSNRCKVAEEDE